MTTAKTPLWRRLSWRNLLNRPENHEFDLPLPSTELRALVGVTDAVDFENPDCRPVFDDISVSHYRSVFDFGCGCGRIARMLIQQEPRPERYVGVDLHRGMINWCIRNLTPAAPEFEFHHHDVFNLGLNPEGSREAVGFPIADDSVTLFVAWSVFTHVSQAAAEFYLSELSRVLHPDGVAVTTWFLFDKTGFPMMQKFQNALFINDVDPTNAVIFDFRWFEQIVGDNGLRISKVTPPEVRGFQWVIQISPAKEGLEHVPFPEDVAPTGIVRPPLTPEGAADFES